MPLIVSPSAAAPAPPASPGSREPARSDDQDTVQTGSFGEAMARSREAGRERTVEPAIKPTPSKPVRRPADAEKSPVQDSVNPMAVLLAAALENRLDVTATAATAATAAIPGRAAAAAGPAANPGAPAAPGLGELLPAAPAGLGDASAPVAGSDTQSGLAPNLVAIASNSADSSPAQARETSSRQGVLKAADLDAQAALAPALAVSVSTGADPVPVSARDTPFGHTIPIATDSPAVTAQADATSAGLSDPSSGPGDDGVKSRAVALDGRADLSPEAADTTPFSGAGGLALPAGAALQQPGNASAPNAPSPVTSALLLPDIGSSEWAKALSQQVIYLNTTDRQVAELQLNPPGLGPLKVTLSMNDQQMQASFISAHSSVRAAVESALPQLRAVLAESGISLGQTSVGAESQPRNAFANGQGHSGSQSPRQTYPVRDAATAALFATPVVAVQHCPGQELRIDTYA